MFFIAIGPLTIWDVHQIGKGVLSLAYKVHTSSRAIASSTIDIGGKPIWLVHDDALERGTWAIFNGQIKVRGPVKLSETLVEDIKAAYRSLPPLDEVEELVPASSPLTLTPTEPAPIALAPVPFLTVTDEETGEVVTVTDDLRMEARSVHEDVVLHGKQSAIHIFEFGRKLKAMRDRSLHLALGFTCFGAYCDAIKLSRSIATERIAAIEELQELQESGSVRPVELPAYTNLVLLSRSHPADVKAVVAQHNVADMSKRKLEEALERAERDRKRAEELDHKLAVLESRFKELQGQEPEIREVKVSDPAQQQEIERIHQENAAKGETIADLSQKSAKLQKWLDETQKDLRELRERVDHNYDLDQKIAIKEQRAKELEQLIAQMQSAFEDGKRNVRGGPELMRVVAPLDRIARDIALRVADLRKAGVGGPAEDADLSKLSKVLRQIAADLDAIVKDRKEIVINVEVSKHV